MQLSARVQERWEVFKTEIRLTREQFLAVVVLAILVAVGGFLTAARSRPHPVEIVRSTRPKAAQGSRSQPKIFVVHVAGAVARPGLYKLASGTRLGAAVEAAGGVTGNGDVNAVNLASRISDGAKILIPEKASAPEAGAPVSPVAPEKGEPLDLNNATAEQLDGLDGIGPVLAKRIVDWRSKHGRFKTVSQLDDVNGIGPKKLLSIKDNVTVGAP